MPSNFSRHGNDGLVLALTQVFFKRVGGHVRHVTNDGAYFCIQSLQLRIVEGHGSTATPRLRRSSADFETGVLDPET